MDHASLCSVWALQLNSFIVLTVLPVGGGTMLHYIHYRPPLPFVLQGGG